MEGRRPQARFCSEAHRKAGEDKRRRSTAEAKAKRRIKERAKKDLSGKQIRKLETLEDLHSKYKLTVREGYVEDGYVPEHDGDF